MDVLLMAKPRSAPNVHASLVRMLRTLILASEKAAKRKL